MLQAKVRGEYSIYKIAMDVITQAYEISYERLDHNMIVV